MRMQLTLRDAAAGSERDILLYADPETPLKEVITALSGGTTGTLWLRGRPLEPVGRLADLGLVDGSVLDVGERPTAPWPLTCGEEYPVEVAVVSGPVSGRSWPAQASFTVGRDASADIPLGDPIVSRLHARFTRTAPPEGSLEPAWVVEDLGSSNGTWVNGSRLTGPRVVGPLDTIEVGASVLELRTPVPRDADVRLRDDGTVAFNRPARLQPANQRVRVDAPRPPVKTDKPSFSWLQAVMPLVMGGVLYVFTHQIATLAFVMLSPVLLVSSAVSQRRRAKQTNERSEREYGARVEAARTEIRTAAAREVFGERARWADPAATAASAAAPSHRLWERRGYDPDALVLRVGVADRPAQIELLGLDVEPPPLDEDPDRLPRLTVPELTALPVVVDLRAAGVLGVAGPESQASALGRWFVTQLAAWHAPRDVAIYLLTSPDGPDTWAWSRWLPHLSQDEPGAAPVRVGNDAATREERIRDLLKVLDARVAADSKRGALWQPMIVVVMDGIRALRAMPGVPRILRDGPAHGIYTIGLDSDRSRLAEEGRAEVVFDAGPAVTATVQVNGVDPVGEVIVDQVSPEWAEEVARRLTPLRDAGGEEGGSMIPSSVRFVDLVGLDLERPEDVLGRWSAGGRTTAVTVGASIDGPFFLDLRRDGPHALVAGTTGSGKSEFLQTLVASLALANRPDAVNFVLVDYKGASAFADCAELPHTVGMVTNLDGQGTERALASLDAELRRREACLSQMRAPDVDAAWEKDPDGAARSGLARLVLVIDEFAELVHELPDFVTGLIRIARVGRSLGVHLILATQRPAGVVTGEMRANTGLRVALRMEDTGDSQEVLEAADAARISRSTPGRAFARLGGGASVVEFQSARVAGRRPGVDAGLPPPLALDLPWRRIGYPVPVPTQARQQTTEGTDLHALVHVIRQAAEAQGFPTPRRPWLPPLPDVLGLDAAAPAGGLEMLSAAYGYEDLPTQQAQRPAVFRLDGGRHLVIAGSARSGRSTALRTLAAALARQVSPADLHLYGLDFGNGALLPLTALPHCGAVALRSEVERTVRLVDRLSEELARRQSLLASRGVGDIAEQRAAADPAERLPYILVLVDRWEGFTATHSIESGSPLPGQVGRLLQEGAGVGILVVIAGDRGLLTDRVTSFVEDRLVLRLANRDDYRLANINPKQVAENPVPGRAMRIETMTEVQIALVEGPAGELDGSAQSQGNAVRAIGEAAALRWPPLEQPNRPFRVDTLPIQITPAEIDDLMRAGRVSSVPPRAGAWAVLGAGGDDLSAQIIDLTSTRGFVVGGPPRSGRSTALRQLARSAADGGAAVLAICPRPSPLAGLEAHPGVEVIDGVPDYAALEVAIKRILGGDRPGVVVIDDAEGFVRSEGDEALRSTLQGAGPTRLVAVVAGTVDDLKTEMRGTVAEARKASAGLLFSPASTFDGDLVGTRLPRALATKMPAGRGCLALDGEWRLVQIPLPG